MGWPETLTTQNIAQALREGQLDWAQAREEIVKDFDRALTAPEREALLGLYKCLMDAVEETIDAAHLDELRKLRAQEYRFLIIKEASLGGDDKFLKPAKLAAVTTREVNAGDYVLTMTSTNWRSLVGSHTARAIGRDRIEDAQLVWTVNAILVSV